MARRTPGVDHFSETAVTDKPSALCFTGRADVVALWVANCQRTHDNGYGGIDNNAMWRYLALASTIRTGGPQ